MYIYYIMKYMQTISEDSIIQLSEIKEKLIEQELIIKKLYAENARLKKELKLKSECNICLTEVDNPIVLVPCGHGNMHYNCIDITSKKCPLCNNDVDKVIKLLN